MIALNLEQGSEQWLKAKLGVISASNVSKVLAKKGTDTRSSYLSELVAQVATCEMPEVNAKSLAWGKEQEESARSAYQFLNGVFVKKVGFIYSEDKRKGCSPDGIIEDLKKGTEIKCPFTSKVHVDFLAMDKIKKEYLDQCQFSMWITGFEAWDFCSYDPRFKKNILKVHTIERDTAFMERLDNEVPEFIKEMDLIMNKLEIKFGQQWE